MRAESAKSSQGAAHTRATTGSGEVQGMASQVGQPGGNPTLGLCTELCHQARMELALDTSLPYRALGSCSPYGTPPRSRRISQGRCISQGRPWLPVNPKFRRGRLPCLRHRGEALLPRCELQTTNGGSFPGASTPARCAGLPLPGSGARYRQLRAAAFVHGKGRAQA